MSLQGEKLLSATTQKFRTLVLISLSITYSSLRLPIYSNPNHCRNNAKLYIFGACSAQRRS
jgi:hypothetical protein